MRFHLLEGDDSFSIAMDTFVSVALAMVLAGIMVIALFGIFIIVKDAIIESKNKRWKKEHLIETKVSNQKVKVVSVFAQNILVTSDYDRDDIPSTEKVIIEYKGERFCLNTKHPEKYLNKLNKEIDAELEMSFFEEKETGKPKREMVFNELKS